MTRSAHARCSVCCNSALLGQEQALEPFDRVLHRERVARGTVTEVPVGLQIPKNFAQQEVSVHSGVACLAVIQRSQ